MPGNQLQLHELIFQNKPEKLQQVIAQTRPDLNVLVRGQTPLTLAIALNRTECISVLLEQGASVLVNNSMGWSPFQEATSYGDRSVMAMIYRRRRKELSQWFNSKGKQLIDQIASDVLDFTLEMHWSFSSIIPFVKDICPSDVYKLYKKGKSFRLDTTLVGFDKLRWMRGRISILFDAQQSKLAICDHDKKIYQVLWPRDIQIDDKIVEEDVSFYLNTPIKGQPDMEWSSFQVSRATSGYLWKTERNEKVGEYDAQVWEVESFQVKSKSRHEHLHANPLPPGKIKQMQEEERRENERKAKRELEQAQKAESKTQAKTQAKSRFVIANPEASSALDSGPDGMGIGVDKLNLQEEEDLFKNYKDGYRNIEDVVAQDVREWSEAQDAFEDMTAFRPSLDPPKPQVTFQDYFRGDLEEYLHVGRPLQQEQKESTYKATLWMHQNSQTFPLTLQHVKPILDLIGISKEMRSLQEFLNVQMPEGFPVQIQVPIWLLPLSAVVSFKNVHKECPEVSFSIPQDYTSGHVISEDDTTRPN